MSLALLCSAIVMLSCDFVSACLMAGIVRSEAFSGSPEQQRPVSIPLKDGGMYKLALKNMNQPPSSHQPTGEMSSDS